jgi:hypothetical protein
MFEVPPNVYFVAACNPYQLKTLSKENQNDIVKVHPSKENLLSHKVLPISPNLLHKIFDYGSLAEETEKKYITNIFEQFSLDVSNKRSEIYIKIICEFVCEGQNMMKYIFNNESAVSLRDVNRVKEVFIFYIYLLQYKNIYKMSSSESFDEYKRLTKFDLSKVTEKHFFIALTVTMYINYIFRLGFDSKISIVKLIKRIKK